MASVGRNSILKSYPRKASGLARHHTDTPGLRLAGSRNRPKSPQFPASTDVTGAIRDILVQSGHFAVIRTNQRTSRVSDSWRYLSCTSRL